MPCKVICVLLLILSVVIRPVPVPAHPHVFAITSIEVVFKEGKPGELKTSWSFDEAYSAMMLEDYDTDKDGKFTGAELALLKEEGFDFVKEDSYYTFLNYNGKRNHPVTIEDFGCLVEEGVVVYTFTVPLTQAPSKGPLRISQYDPQNYTAIFFSEAAPIHFSGKGSEAAKVTFQEDTEVSYYFDMLHPIEAVVTWGGDA